MPFFIDIRRPFRGRVIHTRFFPEPSSQFPASKGVFRRLATDGYSVARLYGKQKPSIQPASTHSFLFANERVRCGRVRQGSWLRL